MFAQQIPPMPQCRGGLSQFAVTGDTLLNFNFEFVDNEGLGRIGGEIVYFNKEKLDSVVVLWGMETGLFSLGVQEIFGTCESEMVYIPVEVRGNPFHFEESTLTIGTGETIQINVDPLLYKNVRWSDPNVATQGITLPGEYQIWVEDMHGCRYTDTITIIPAKSSPIEN